MSETVVSEEELKDELAEVVQGFIVALEDRNVDAMGKMISCRAMRPLSRLSVGKISDTALNRIVKSYSGTTDVCPLTTRRKSRRRYERRVRVAVGQCQKEVAVVREGGSWRILALSGISGSLGSPLGETGAMLW